MIMILFLIVFTAHILILVMNVAWIFSSEDGAYNNCFTFWLASISMITFLFFSSKSINLFLVGA